jgi:hypothetical protein
VTSVVLPAIVADVEKVEVVVAEIAVPNSRL